MSNIFENVLMPNCISKCLKIFYQYFELCHIFMFLMSPFEKQLVQKKSVYSKLFLMFKREVHFCRYCNSGIFIFETSEF